MPPSACETESRLLLCMRQPPLHSVSLSGGSHRPCRPARRLRQTGEQSTGATQRQGSQTP
eukprot:13739801-Alexandrium_andersonii.AAC.1